MQHLSTEIRSRGFEKPTSGGTHFFHVTIVPGHAYNSSNFSSRTCRPRQRSPISKSTLSTCFFQLARGHYKGREGNRVPELSPWSTFSIALRRDFRAPSCSRFLSAATALPTSSPHTSFACTCAAVVCSCIHQPEQSSAQFMISFWLRLQAPSSAGTNAGAAGEERDDDAPVAC
jgi:hypothetical protein